jgi:hypothetical protein
MDLVLAGTEILAQGDIDQEVIITLVQVQDIQENQSNNNSGLEEIILAISNNSDMIYSTAIVHIFIYISYHMKVQSAKKCTKRVGKNHTCRVKVGILSVGGKEAK